MFESFNTEEFGKFLRDVRESLNLTQSDVERMTGLNRDTVRRIEQGKVLIRYDTLVLLSSAYKKDLLEDLKTYGSSSILLNYYRKLDDLIIHYDLETLQDLKRDFENFSKTEKIDNPIDYNSKRQFDKLLSGISNYMSQYIEESYKDFYESMVLGNPMFTIEDYKNFKYTVLEMRILLMLALVLSLQNKFITSNEILIYCLEQINLNKNSTMNEKLLGIKLYSNISYNYHRLDYNELALTYAKMGIEFCTKTYIFYGLANLLYRKGIAQYNLNIESYKDSLQQSVNMLIIENKNDLAQKYVEVTKESYGIILDLE